MRQNLSGAQKEGFSSLLIPRNAAQRTISQLGGK